MTDTIAILAATANDARREGFLAGAEAMRMRVLNVLHDEHGNSTMARAAIRAIDPASLSNGLR